MAKGFEKFPAILKSAVSDNTETADSLGGNRIPLPPEQLNSNEKRLETQRKNRKNPTVNHDKNEKEEWKQYEKTCDAELEEAYEPKITSENLQAFLDKYFPKNSEAENEARTYMEELKSAGISILVEDLKKHIQEKIDFSSDTVSKEDEVKALDKKLNEEGKSDTEILQILISTFGSEESLKNMVENWRNFLELHRFAKSKPPTERKAIETIITISNFTTENSFEMALSEIEKSSDISAETKLDIQRRFKTTGINTIQAFDRTLKNEKKFKKSIEKKIQSRNSDIENLNDEIENLTSKLDKLPTYHPKRSGLVQKIKEKSNLIESYEQELSILNEAKPNKIQFQLRNDLMGVLNPDGSRSINIGSENSTIQLPGNNLPLMGTKNLRSINVAFPYLALRSQQISNEIFAPDLVNDSVPTKAQRSMAHTILSSLGIDDSRILSEKDIAQLKNDLSHLTNAKSGKTGRECLVELGIYDVASQNVNKTQLKKALRFIQENRGENMDFQMIKKCFLL